MATFLEVLIAAATLQALVLPGEKAQMIIAGLSTKYRPVPVVAGAGVAFAGWTALEETSVFEPMKAYDRLRFETGLPHRDMEPADAPEE